MTTADDPRPAVLVIDDDASLREALIFLLTDDFRVVTAATGAEGLACLAQETISLVLLDLCLPGMHGLEVLHHITTQAPGTTVVILSAVQDLATIEAALHGGAVDFLPKPCDGTLLCARLHRALVHASSSHPCSMPPA